MCCERLVESGATNVIFTLIRSCNRSVPCMEVITFSVQILLNLSKVPTHTHTHLYRIRFKVNGGRIYFSLLVSILQTRLFWCKVPP